MEKALQPAEEKAVRAAIVADAEDHEARGKGLIRLSSLPAHVAAKLSQYDKDGDGTLDWSEVFSGALDHEEATKKSRFYAKLFLILFLVWLAQLGCTFGVVFGVVTYAKDSQRLSPEDPVFRVKGSGTPVQCASSDITIDPVTGHLVMRETTPYASVTLNYNASDTLASDLSITVAPGRKLLSAPSNGNAIGRSLLTDSNTNTPVVTMSSVCTWHSTDFYNPDTGSFLTGTCSQFPYSRVANIPMLANGGQTTPHYHPATLALDITSVAWISMGYEAYTAFCYSDLYRFSLGVNGSLDFCFVPWPACSSSVKTNCCPTKDSSGKPNCPTMPFVNYANLKFDENLFDLPCVKNLHGQVGFSKDPAFVATAKNDACIKPVGHFNEGQGDPLYSMSKQLPTNNVGSKDWYPAGASSTDSSKDGWNSRRRLNSRELLSFPGGTGGMGH